MNLWDMITTKLLEGLIGYASRKAWVWVVGQVKWRRFSPWFKNYVIKIEQFSVSQKPRKPLGIQRIGKIERTEKDEILQDWQASNHIILTGTAGSGKTGIGWQVAKALKDKNNVVLYLDCSLISTNQTIPEFLQSNIDKGEDIEQALQKIGIATTLYFILDQMEQFVRIPQLSNGMQVIQRLAHTQGIRILLIVRDVEYEQSKELQDFGFPIVHSRELRFEDARTYLISIGVSSPPNNLARLAQNLFNLSLIADIYAPGRDVRDVLGQVQLLEMYINYVTLKGGTKAIERAVDLARKHMTLPQTGLGGSISDPSIRALLSLGVLIVDPLQRLRFRHEMIEECICAYGLLPHTPTLPNLLGEFGESSTRRIVPWLIGMYHDKSPHDEIKLTAAVLASGLTFYFKASILDAVRFQRTPTIEMAAVIAKFLESGKESYTKYFFQGLDNPDWIELFHSLEYFYVIPPPKEDPRIPGSFSLPFWYAGEYLKSMADIFPDIIKEVALHLDSENARAIRTILEAILATPPAVAAQTVDEFERWSKTRFAYVDMLSHEMGLVMEHLAKGGQVDAALRVLSIITEPTPTTDRFVEGKIIARAHHDLYWLNEAFIHNLPSLLKIDSISVIHVLEHQLVEAIDMETDPHIPKEKYPAYSYWRLNIVSGSVGGQPRDLKNLLVNILIRALTDACEQGRTEVPNILSKYLDSPYVILKRIAVYLLRIKGNKYPDLVEKAYRAWEKAGWAGGLDEFEHFLDAQFGILSSGTQEEILSSIYDYMKDDKFAEWAEQAIIQSPDRFIGNSNEKKKDSFAEEYEFRQLHRFAQWLTGAAKQRYQELSPKYEPPPPRPESGVIITSWESEQSPVEIDELAEKTVPEIVQYLVDFVPEGEGFRTPSREGLAQVFRTTVKNRLSEFVENSSLLIRDDLPFTFHESFLMALEDAIKAGQQIQIGHIIGLCEFIACIKEDNFKKQPHESGLPHAKLALANLLQEFLKTKEPYVDNVILDRIGQMVLYLVNETNDPFLKQEVEEQDPTNIDTRTLNTNLDAATLSLNSICGVAMHCLISFALYCERKRKVDSGDIDKPLMVPLVKDTLLKKLDQTGDTSLAVHAVLGWYFPQLMYLDKQWAIDKLEKVFPANQDFIPYWLTAWSAYVRFSDVYVNVFGHLVDHYKIAIELLPRQKAQAFDRIDERLAEHLLKAYLMGLIAIDSEEGLLRLYYEKAPDEIRSHGNFWLSQVLSAQHSAPEDKVWIRMWNLWQWRIAVAISAENKDNYSKEITSFCWLLDNTPLELDALYSVLSQTIEFHGEGHFEFIQIIEYLSKNAKKHLRYAVELLYAIVERKALSYLTNDTRDNIRSILEQVKISKDAVSRQRAVKIINILAEEWGDYEWRVFLDDMGQDE